MVDTLSSVRRAARNTRAATIGAVRLLAVASHLAEPTLVARTRRKVVVTFGVFPSALVRIHSGLVGLFVRAERTVLVTCVQPKRRAVKRRSRLGKCRASAAEAREPPRFVRQRSSQSFRRTDYVGPPGKAR